VKDILVYARRAGVGLALLALAACGAGGVKPPAAAQDDSVLKQLSTERWNLLIAHQAGKAYDYLTPGTRATQTRDKYAAEMSNRPVHWKSVEYVDHKCDDPDACTVQLRAAYSVNMNARMGPVDSVTLVWERWIRVDGRWYYLPEHTSMTPKAAAPAPQAREPGNGVGA
jgi:uncharacterized protein YchJ